MARAGHAASGTTWAPPQEAVSSPAPIFYFLLLDVDILGTGSTYILTTTGTAMTQNQVATVTKERSKNFCKGPDSKYFQLYSQEATVVIIQLCHLSGKAAIDKT